MKKSGFTLTEMLVTISILAILLAIGVPSFKELISSSNMVSNANGMIGAFNYARAEAIKRGDTVSVSHIGADWTEGILVSNTTTGTIRLWPAFDDVATVSSVQSSFSFSAIGEVNNADVLQICDDRTGEEGMQITLLISGVVISEKITCG